MERLEILEILVSHNGAVPDSGGCGTVVHGGCSGIQCGECPLNPEGATFLSVREEYELLTAPPKAEPAETYTGGSSDYY